MRPSKSSAVRNSRHMFDDDDPLTTALNPPPDESEAQRAVRVSAEAEAQRISDEIDTQLQEEHRAEEWRRKALKVLLLGQAESGKSTVLKNFQLLHSPNWFDNEKKAWKAVIQLNLIQSVSRLWDALETQLLKSRPSSASPLPTLSRCSPELQRLKLKLSPLQQIQTPLKRYLEPHANNGDDFYVRSGSDWAKDLDRPSSPRNGGRTTPGSYGSATETATMVLHGCGDDMVALWNLPEVKKILGAQKLKLINTPGFFLPDAERITAWNYEPTESDILRARLRTLGVREHAFKHGKTSTGILGKQDWIIYDVGGARSQRDRWSPYFEHVNSIIFLAPISAFDEQMEEDPRYNRLTDSIAIWRQICSNKLLSKAAIILFLNKIDLLEAKLASGIRISSHLKPYGDRANDVQTFIKFIRGVFKQDMAKLSQSPRAFLCFETAAINHTSTAQIIGSVRDSILRDSLLSTSVV